MDGLLYDRNSLAALEGVESIIARGEALSTPPDNVSETYGEALNPATMPEIQHTLASVLRFEGVGLHSGKPVHLTLRPAPADTGLVFVRTDLKGERRVIPARYDLVNDTTLCTQLGHDAEHRVATVEHLLAALSAYNIDNAFIDVDSPEIPVLDGSSQPFVFALDCLGVAAQAAQRRYLKVLKPVRVSTPGNEAHWLEIVPASQFEVDTTIRYAHPAIGTLRATVEVTPANFRRELAPARTFCLETDITRMQHAGLAKGGSLENAVVVGETGVLNPEGLRFPDEFARHKALDVIGDFALAGLPILGRVQGGPPGHTINNRLLRALMADLAAYEIVTL